MVLHNFSVKHRWLMGAVLPVLMLSSAVTASADSDEIISTRTITDRPEAVPETVTGDRAPTISTLNQNQVLERLSALSPIERSRSLPFGEAEPTEEKRRIRSEVGVSVGTGGYRSGYVSTLIPLGDNGLLGITIGQTDFGKNYPVYGHYPYDYSPYRAGYSTYKRQGTLDMSGRYLFPQADDRGHCATDEFTSDSRRSHAMHSRCLAND